MGFIYKILANGIPYQNITWSSLPNYKGLPYQNITSGVPYLEDFLVTGVARGVWGDVPDLARLADGVDAHHKVLDVASQDRRVDDLRRLEQNNRSWLRLVWCTQKKLW